jgi:hypothetical protein
MKTDFFCFLLLWSKEHALVLLAIPAVALKVLYRLSVTPWTQDMASDKTYPVEVLVVNVALLERALDLLLGIGRQLVVAVNQLEILLGSLPPVVDDIRRDASPVPRVSNVTSRWSQNAKTSYQ